MRPSSGFKSSQPAVWPSRRTHGRRRFARPYQNPRPTEIPEDPPIPKPEDMRAVRPAAFLEAEPVKPPEREPPEPEP